MDNRSKVKEKGGNGLAPEWSKKENCTQCGTKLKIGPIWRDHHCRNCGQAFCTACSAFEHPIPAFGYNEPVRVCYSCNSILSNRSRERASESERELSRQSSGSVAKKDELDVDVANAEGITALMSAAKGGNLRMVKHLIEELGANPDLRDKSGQRALDWAKKSDKPATDVIAYLSALPKLDTSGTPAAGRKKLHDKKPSATPVAGGAAGIAPPKIKPASPMDKWFKNATIDELLAKLTNVSEGVDHLFRKVFLLNHVCFMSSAELIKRLQKVYDLPPLHFKDDARLWMLSKLNVISILSDWSQLFWADIDHSRSDNKDVMKMLDRFCRVPELPELAAVKSLISATTGTQPNVPPSPANGGGADDVTEEDLGISFGPPQREDKGVDEKKVSLFITGGLSLAALDKMVDRLSEEHKNLAETFVKQDHKQKSKKALGFVTVIGDFAKHFSGEVPDVFTFSPLQIAQQLTALDMAMLRDTQPREFIRKEWTRKETSSIKAANITRMVDTFNARSYWVASQVLAHQDLDARVNALKNMVGVASECRALHNFYSCYAILNGLSVTPVHRLKRTWEELPRSSKQKFKMMKQDLDNAKNFVSYRTIFQTGEDEQIPQVPHLVVVLNDLYQLEEVPGVNKEAGKPDVVNWFRYSSQYRVLQGLLNCQQRKYEIVDDSKILLALYQQQEKVRSEEELFELSYAYEPKSEAHTFELRWKKAALEEKMDMIAEQHRLIEAQRAPIEAARRRRADIEAQLRADEDAQLKGLMDRMDVMTEWMKKEAVTEADKLNKNKNYEMGSSSDSKTESKLTTQNSTSSISSTSQTPSATSTPIIDKRALSPALFSPSSNSSALSSAGSHSSNPFLSPTSAPSSALAFSSASSLSTSSSSSSVTASSLSAASAASSAAQSELIQKGKQSLVAGVDVQRLLAITASGALTKQSKLVVVRHENDKENKFYLRVKDGNNSRPTSPRRPAPHLHESSSSSSSSSSSTSTSPSLFTASLAQEDDMLLNSSFTVTTGNESGMFKKAKSSPNTPHATDAQLCFSFCSITPKKEMSIICASKDVCDQLVAALISLTST